jgi:hypothetical protein
MLELFPGSDDISMPNQGPRTGSSRIQRRLLVLDNGRFLAPRFSPESSCHTLLSVQRLIARTIPRLKAPVAASFPPHCSYSVSWLRSWHHCLPGESYVFLTLVPIVQSLFSMVVFWISFAPWTYSRRLSVRAPDCDELRHDPRLLRRVGFHARPVVLTITPTVVPCAARRARSAGSCSCRQHPGPCSRMDGSLTSSLVCPLGDVRFDAAPAATFA